jgi:hypothetical protein
VRVLSDELCARTFRGAAPQRILPPNSLARRLAEEFDRRAIPSPREFFVWLQKYSTRPSNFCARGKLFRDLARSSLRGAKNQTRGALLRARAEKFERLARAIVDQENDSEPSRFLRAAGEKFRAQAR